MGKCFDFLNQILATKFWGKCMEISLVNLFVDTHYWGSKGVKKLLVGEVWRISPEDTRVLLGKE